MPLLAPKGQKTLWDHLVAVTEEIVENACLIPTREAEKDFKGHVTTH